MIEFASPRGSLAVPSRRRFLLGAGALLAAPAIVRVASIMPVSVMKPTGWEHMATLGPAMFWGDGAPRIQAAIGSLYMTPRGVWFMTGGGWKNPAFRRSA